MYKCFKPLVVIRWHYCRRPRSPHGLLLTRPAAAVLLGKGTGNLKKLLQYANDTTAVLSDINSAQTLLRLLDDFKKLSGLEVDPT